MRPPYCPGSLSLPTFLFDAFYSIFIQIYDFHSIFIQYLFKLRIEFNINSIFIQINDLIQY